MNTTTRPKPAKNIKRHGLAAVGLGVLLITVAWMFFATYRLGFNPTDDGYVVSQAYRVLNGDLPHRDFITPRPAGSAFIHTIDFAVPLPLLESSRLIATAQVLAYTALLYAMVSGKSIRRWGILSYLGVAAAFLVNIHTFPLMSWQTIDGILLTVAGWVLVQTRETSRVARVIGFLLLGAAPLVKQSFVLSPVMGLVIVVTQRWREDSRWGAFATAAAVMTIPGGVYLALLTVTGGLDEAYTQLSNAQVVFEPTIWMPFADGVIGWSFAGILVIVAILTAIRLQRNDGADGLRYDWVVFGSIAALVTSMLWKGDFEFAGLWGVELLWVLIAITVTEAVLKRVRLPQVCLVVLGLMTMLSWGHPVPNLVGGSLALGVLVAVWPREKRTLAGKPLLLFTSGCLLVLIALTVAVIEARMERPYYEKSVEHLTFSLGTVAEGFGRIRTNEITGEHLASLKQCIDDHPAREVAFLPDNPVLYALLGVSNPLSLDFLIPPEYTGSEERIRSEVEAMNARGDYLVLIQGYSAYRLPKMTKIPIADDRTRPFLYDDSLESPWVLETAGELFRSLDGERITCGGFVGLYSNVDDRVG